MDDSTHSGSGGEVWGDGPITAEQAGRFAALAVSSPREREVVAANLLGYPLTVRVRGVFFEGLLRIIDQARGAESVAALRSAAGLPDRLVAFSQYAHRDFYKLYYLAAPLLHPGAPLPTALRRVAQTFFPIFQESLLGRTMSALMGERPRTILPLLAKAYNVSVEGNLHVCEVVGEAEATWQCSVEPVEWYAETFAGIVEGTMKAHKAPNVKVVVVEQARGRDVGKYKFRVTW